MRLETRLIVEEALEAESPDAIGRGYLRTERGLAKGTATGRVRAA